MSLNVTKSFAPPLDEYIEYLKEIWANGAFTNNGKMVKQLENELAKFLDVQNISYVTNGTVALQLAISALEIDGGEIITTPFTYVATSSSILWQKCKPVFVDIEPNNLTINSKEIEKAITKDTQAIMAVHVFGYACNVEEISQIANKYGLKVIYDGAHAFGSKYKGKSLLSYGDISTLSFHATKLFHTVEGGACIVKDKKLLEKVSLQKSFGHIGDNHICLGINAKQSELHAAFGLCSLKYAQDILDKRKTVSLIYDSLLNFSFFRKPNKQKDLEHNCSYYPIIFNDEKTTLKVINNLKKHDIYPRRYFYPSLDSLPYISCKNRCKISADVSKSIICLPLSFYTSYSEVELVSNIVNKSK